MAKKLKKINQPKKYLQGGSNLGSVSQSRQNPMYLEQGYKNAYTDSLDLLKATQQNAVQAKQEEKTAAANTLSTNSKNALATLKDPIKGALFKTTPQMIGNTDPLAFINPAAPSIGTGTAIEGVGVLSPEYLPAAQAGLGTSVDAGVGVLAPEYIAPAATNNAAVQVGSKAVGVSNAALAGVSAAATIGGEVWKYKSNDKNPYTFTNKERTGNMGGSILSSAGTGAGIGTMIMPGVGTAVGAVIGGTIGGIKAHNQNKASESEAERLQRELAAQRGAYQSAFVNSRLTGADTGFGLNSSTNMNNQFTNQYQVAKLGGPTSIQEDRRTKKVPGGKIVPIEGTDAVEFVGKSHAQGGIHVDNKTEVEGGETQDQVIMNNDTPKEYIFSKYLKLGGKSFAQRHKEILKSGGNQTQIQELAAMQEKVAGRNPQQVAQYGGIHKYAAGGQTCPPGYVLDPATGNCVPEESGVQNNLEFNTTTPPAPAKQVMVSRKQITPTAIDVPAVPNGRSSMPDGASLVETRVPQAANYVAPATIQPPVQPVATTQPTTNTNPNPPQPAGGPTTTYINSTQPQNQTPEEAEAARLASLPRYFMGASRKVDETTGDVTIDKGKPLMGVGAMEGSRLGTATGTSESLAGITSNRYDQAWKNKSDSLYAKTKSGNGALSYSDYVGDRDKIAESNWGKKYGYTKGMSEAEAKAAHGRFEADVHSLFNNKPEEILGYFKYIIDGGDEKASNYLGEDAKQIRANLQSKGFIDANGQVISGKESAMAAYLEKQATNSAVGPIHNALGSYTAETGAGKIKLEQKKKQDEPAQPLADKINACPPGTYRSGDQCVPVGDIPAGKRVDGALLAGLGQLIPVGAALANPYKIAPGIAGAPAVKGALLPRENMNQERASTIQAGVAMKNAVMNQNAGPGALAVMQNVAANSNDQMLKIAKQEQDANKQLASQEGELGMKASMFNAENGLKTSMFNKEFNQKERQYRREDIFGALDAGAARVAGVFKDQRNYLAQERLAKSLDETGSYDRYSILEKLQKEAKQKDSPYYGKNEVELRKIAAAMYTSINPDGYTAKPAKKEEKEEKKFGGARQYVSRLGELGNVRSTKVKK